VVSEVKPGDPNAIVEDVALDPKTDTLYCTYNTVIDQYMNTAGRVARMSTDGSGVQDIVKPQSSNVGGIAVDPGAQEIYWYDGAIESAAPDGSGIQTLYTDVNSLNGLTIDRASNALYWTRGGGYQKIETGGTDGSGRHTLVTDVANEYDSLDAPYALAVDPENAKMYWTDIDTYRDPFGIYHAEMDGDGSERLHHAYDAYGIAVGPVPEPATMALLSIGGLAFLTRRRL
jgi:hypothetical protein